MLKYGVPDEDLGEDTLRDLTLRVAGIMDDSIVDGPGFRLALFVQGCSRHCPGCHNPQTWDPSGGEERTVQDVISYVENTALKKSITISGGEPMDQPDAVLEILRYLHERGWHTMLYTGYTLEELSPVQRKLLPYTDILVDGPYVESERSLELLWRGSSNQRVLLRGTDYV